MVIYLKDRCGGTTAKTTSRPWANIVVELIVARHFLRYVLIAVCVTVKNQLAC